MPLLNEADEIFLGDQRAEEIYVGDTKTWVFVAAFTETLFEPLGAFVAGSISTS